MCVCFCCFFLSKRNKCVSEKIFTWYSHAMVRSWCCTAESVLYRVHVQSTTNVLTRAEPMSIGKKRWKSFFFLLSRWWFWLGWHFTWMPEMTRQFDGFSTDNRIKIAMLDTKAANSGIFNGSFSRLCLGYFHYVCVFYNSSKRIDTL